MTKITNIFEVLQKKTEFLYIRYNISNNISAFYIYTHLGDEYNDKFMFYSLVCISLGIQDIHHIS